MKGPKRVLLLAGTCALIWTAIAVAKDPPKGPWRPTCHEAKRAVQMTLTSYAELFDGQLVVGPCAKRGEATRILRVRITGPVELRLRVFVSADGESAYIRARPLPLLGRQN